MSEALALRGEHAPGLLSEARKALVEWVRDGGSAGRTFLQVHLRAGEDGCFRIRHEADRAVPDEELRRSENPFTAREIAQTTSAGEHRPLKTAPNLRRGWLLASLDERGLWTAMDYLYPACVVHWHAGRIGGLRVTPWAATAARQSGMYGSVRLLTEEPIRDAVKACCGDAVCLRQVAWGISESDPAPLDSRSRLDEEAPRPDSEAAVPCPEACSMFISFARAVLAVERKPRREIGTLGAVNEVELLQLRRLVTSAAIPSAGEPREGEFDDPLNRRRLRYLAERIGATPERADGGDS